MPWYRINGMAVHLHGRKLPPACVAIVVIEGKRVRCAAISSIECDWPVAKGRTCDAPLCADHAWEMGPDQHICPPHLELQAQQGQGGLFTSLMETEQWGS
jgi:hypothetical protein